MKSFNLESLKLRAKAIAGALRDRGAVTAGLVGTAIAPGMAFAADSFDSAAILAAVAMMLAAGIAIYTAYAVGKWTLRAFGLIGGK